MFLLKTVSPQEATGQLANIYAAFPREIGLPKPLELVSASPPMLEKQIAAIAYYRSHKRLSPPLLAAIRYLAAEKSGHPFCIDFNAGLLLRMGLTAKDLAGLKADPKNSNLDEDETAMLAFVAKALSTPESVTSQDIEALRAQGFDDTDIYDAMAHGAQIMAGAVLYKTFYRE
jgi:alkylhydroperoxidase family enzyme